MIRDLKIVRHLKFQFVFEWFVFNVSLRKLKSQLLHSKYFFYSWTEARWLLKVWLNRQIRRIFFVLFKDFKTLCKPSYVWIALIVPGYVYDIIIAKCLCKPVHTSVLIWMVMFWWPPTHLKAWKYVNWSHYVWNIKPVAKNSHKRNNVSGILFIVVKRNLHKYASFVITILLQNNFEAIQEKK